MDRDNRALNILISAIGSHGDVHPFLGVAKVLRRRGHRVTILAPPMFGELVGSLGMEFVPVGSVDLFERVTGDPDLWHPWRGFQTVMRAIAELTEPSFRAIVERN